MLRNMFRLTLSVAVMLASLAAAVAQDRDKSADDYRRFFRKPENILEFWKALQFELDVGRPDLAARHLRGLLFLKPSDAQILDLVEKVGLTPILKLRVVRVWSRDKKVQEQAVKDVAELIRLTSAAARKRRADPVRIGDLIRRLKATPEERTYAQRELIDSGGPAMPYLLEALRKASNPSDRQVIRGALERMGGPGLAPLLAALDSNDTQLKLDILDILRRHYARYGSQIVPHLWYPSASKDENALVRKKAKEILADFLDTPISRLTPAKVALTRLAEDFYQHRATVTRTRDSDRAGGAGDVVIWRWNGKGVVQGWPPVLTVSPSQAEEYWGLRFARQALQIDPAYRPAQVAFLSMAVDKAMKRGGLGAPLSRTSPEVAGLVSKASTDLLLEMLDRSLKEQRTGVLLATARALGDRAEVRAKRPSGRGDPPLVRALYYPDPRVQLTAAESLLLIPGPPAPKTAARIVDIMGRLLSPATAARAGRRVIVGIYEEGWRNKASTAVIGAGVHPVLVSNGRDLMRQVRARGDVDAILLDSLLPQPGLAHLLAQLRADVDVGKVPILLAAVPQTRASLDLAARAHVIDGELQLISAETRSYRAALQAIDDEEAVGLKEVKAAKYTSRDDQETAERIFRGKFEAAREKLDRNFLDSVRAMKRVGKLEDEKDRLAARYDREAQVREEQLDRFTARYKNIRVVHASLFTDAKALDVAMKAAIREAGVALTPEERARFAEIAVQILAKLAMGQPRGYDVTPATGVLVEALRTGRLSPRGQIDAIDAIARLPGPRTQVELVHTILDTARPANVRTAAAEGLVQSVQRFGVQLSPSQVAPVRTLAREAKLPAGLKAQLGVLIGALRPNARSTGERLKRYDPRPVAPLAPPK